jgi:hypothetical protein
MLLMLTLAGCGSSDDFEVNRESCERYRDHLVELRLRDTNPAIDTRPHRAAMKQALGDQFVATCQQQLTPEQLKCTMHAGDLASATACTVSESK